jgi:hypothetical protein
VVPPETTANASTAGTADVNTGNCEILRSAILVNC